MVEVAVATAAAAVLIIRLKPKLGLAVVDRFNDP